MDTTNVNMQELINAFKALQNDRFTNEKDYNDWEHGFIESIGNLISRFGPNLKLSPRQINKIKDLIEKHVPEELDEQDDPEYPPLDAYDKDPF